jgi:diguanylate cyclase (GGDEF)-like protein
MPAASGEVQPRSEQKTITNEVVPIWSAKRTRGVLVRMDSLHAGHVTALAGPEVRLGRHSSNDLVVDDEGISRTHAVVGRDETGYFIEDLGSSNGTFVNGERIQRARLFDGVVVQLGSRVCFRFSLADENQEQIFRRLYETSVRDSLTGTYNRHFFQERLNAELAYAIRHRADLSLLIFDVDYFKKINDTYGHAGGDAVLKSLAAEAMRLLRAEDLLARWGGEEFVVLLRGIALSGAAKAAERIRMAVERLRTASGNDVISTTVSVGCASTRCPERLDATTLVAVADRRLYTAKREGRNRVTSAD